MLIGSPLSKKLILKNPEAGYSVFQNIFYTLSGCSANAAPTARNQQSPRPPCLTPAGRIPPVPHKSSLLADPLLLEP